MCDKITQYFNLSTIPISHYRQDSHNFMLRKMQRGDRGGTVVKVAGSIPDGVNGILHWHNPSDRTMALVSTQPVTEMSTRRISWG